jgi:hypothetical protein
MRKLLAALIVLSACAEDGTDSSSNGPSPNAEEGGLPVLSAHRVPKGTKILIDAKMGDPAWKKLSPLAVALEGDGVQSVQLKAAYDDEWLYLLAVWPDETLSLNRYWEYVALGEWKKHVGEDGFSICWSPGADGDAFREQGCALYCHDDRHMSPKERGYADFWYWGSQTTGRKPVLRDLWLPFGEKQRLRGDSQPDGSDNVFNRSDEYEGPWGVPKRVGPKRNAMFLDMSNAQELTRERLVTKLNVEKNLGWKVALDLQRPIKGSRADVLARGRHLDGQAWVLELARKLRTGHTDDQPLGDPIVGFRFAVAIHEASEKGAHTISGPIELRFR